MRIIIAVPIIHACLYIYYICIVIRRIHRYVQCLRVEVFHDNFLLVYTRHIIDNFYRLKIVNFFDVQLTTVNWFLYSIIYILYKIYQNISWERNIFYSFDLAEIFNFEFDFWNALLHYYIRHIVCTYDIIHCVIVHGNPSADITYNTSC